MPAAYKQEVKIGTATILCSTDGEVKEYDAEIRKIDLNHEDTNKSFVIKVTDKELLEATGGIVQGLSGSPVIQNGKIIGAVTHVFVQDASSGYGIFIENMLKNTDSLKGLVKIFKQYKYQIKEFSGQHSIDFDNPDDVSKLLGYIYSL